MPPMTGSRNARVPRRSSSPPIFCSPTAVSRQGPASLRQMASRLPPTRSAPLSPRGLSWPTSALVERPSAALLLLQRVIDPAFLPRLRSEEHTSELQSLLRISYAVFCLQKQKQNHINHSK